MKKGSSLAIVLVMLVCILAGCLDPENTEPGVTIGEATENTVVQQNPIDTDSPTSSTPGVVIPPIAPDNPGNTLVAFDPNREIYIFYDNIGLTVYKDYSTKPSVGVHIISKKTLDVNSISLELSAKSEYMLLTGEIKLKGYAHETTVPDRSQFCYELYQCYMGKDFAELWKLEQAYVAAQEAYFEKQEMSQEEFFAIEQAYFNCRDAEKESFQKLTLADLPDFHVYYATAMFVGGVIEEETITEGTLRIGEMSCTLVLDGVRITKEKPGFPVELDWENGGGYPTDGILGSGNDPHPYNDGIHRIEGYFSFTAEHAMSLTDLKLDAPDHKLVGVWLEIVNSKGYTYSGKWDLSNPFLVMPGDRVRVHVAYRDEGIDSLSYCTKVWGFLVYEWEKGMSCKLSECDIRTAGGMNFYELYAIIFDGLDMESYYRDYYYPKYESWRQDIN